MNEDNYIINVAGWSYVSRDRETLSYTCPHGCGAVVNDPKKHEIFHKDLQSLAKMCGMSSKLHF